MAITGRFTQQVRAVKPQGRIKQQTAPQRKYLKGSVRQQATSRSKINQQQRIARIYRELTAFNSGLTYGNYKTRYYKLSPDARKRVPTPTEIKQRSKK